MLFLSAFHLRNVKHYLKREKMCRHMWAHTAKHTTVVSECWFPVRTLSLLFWWDKTVLLWDCMS